MLLICLLAPASTSVGADGKTQLSAEDRELLEYLELLEQLDLLEEWDPAEVLPPSELSGLPQRDADAK